MAIDTAAKRARALNTFLTAGYATGPVPGGSADRPFVVHQYFEAGAAGNTAGTRHQRRIASVTRRRKKGCC